MCCWWVCAASSKREDSTALEDLEGLFQSPVILCKKWHEEKSTTCKGIALMLQEGVVYSRGEGGSTAPEGGYTWLCSLLGLTGVSGLCHSRGSVGSTGSSGDTCAGAHSSGLQLSHSPGLRYTHACIYYLPWAFISSFFNLCASHSLIFLIFWCYALFPGCAVWRCFYSLSLFHKLKINP